MQLNKPYLEQLEKIDNSAPIDCQLVDPNGATTIAYGAKGLNWKGKLKYWLLMAKYHGELEAIYAKAKRTGHIYYGPFKGEFGHFLLHTLPFLFHMHRLGVHIHYCGMELHKPFLVDQEGRSIISEWFPIRDFFKEVKPLANETALPADIAQEVMIFKQKAKAANAAFLDISLNDRYWFAFRNWQLNGRQNFYSLEKIYSQGKISQCVIFPRQKGGVFTPNNGGPWDYAQLAELVSSYFDKVLLVGHPSMSADVLPSSKYELCISRDNTDTLKYCAESQLIITQHSGALHLGAYVNTPVLVIYKGEKPIKGLIDTLRFRVNMEAQPLNYAFSKLEVEAFVSKFKS